MNKSLVTSPLILAGAAALGYAGFRALQQHHGNTEDEREAFRGKIAIVTGGASGIGRALCHELGHGGAVVVVADINLQDAQKVASTITSAGGQAQAALLDVTQAKDVQALVEQIASEHGRLDYMFNNAGIAIGGEVRDMDWEHWQRILGVNLWGVIHGTTAAYRVMTSQGFGHIVNTASVAGLIPTPMLTAYGTTKHAVVGLSTSLRVEAEEYGVKVSAVCPGFIHTNLFDAATYVTVPPDAARTYISSLTMTDATDCARAILRGVVRNQALIVVTGFAHCVWRLQRFNPVLVLPVVRKMARDFRASKSKAQV